MSVIGYIYVLKNEHIQPVKIGYTDRTPQQRADELSNFTGVPGKWRVCKSWKLSNAYDWEQKIFRELATYRSDGEFFLLTHDKAVELITLFLINSNAINSDGLSQEEVSDIRARNAEFDLRTKRVGVEQKWKTVEAEFSNKAEAEAENIYGKTIVQLYIEEKNSEKFFGGKIDFISESIFGKIVGFICGIVFFVTFPFWIIPFLLCGFLFSSLRALFTDEKVRIEENQYAVMRNKIENKQRELLKAYKKKFMREYGIND